MGGAGRLASRLSGRPGIAAGALAALGLALTLHGLGDHPLVDFDEAVHAGFIRAMVGGHHWLAPVFDGTRRLRKPPLYFWTAALVARALGGATALTDRLPAAVAGVAAATLVAVASARLWGWRRGGLVGGVALITMPQFLMLSRAAMLDTMSAALVGVAIVSGSRVLRGRGGWRLGCLLGAALGLEAMERSAMVLVPLMVLAVDAVWLGWPPRARWGPLGVAGGVALAIALPWPIAMTLRDPHQFLASFVLQNVVDRVTGTVQQAPLPPTFYLPLLAAGLGAWAPLVALAASTSWRRAWHERDSAERLAAIWIVVTVVAFTASRTKLDWYVLPAYPACALLLAAWFGRRLDARDHPGTPDPATPPPREARVPGWLVALAGVAGGALGLWWAPRPVATLGVAGLVGAAGLWWSLGRASTAAGTAASSGLTARLAAAAIAAVLVVAVGRAAAAPLTMGTPGLALSLEPEPDTQAEAALGRFAARAPGVPLAVLDNTYPTLLYYSRRAAITTVTSPAAAVAARGDWLVAPAAVVPGLRRSTGTLTVLARRGPLVLLRLPGAPAPPRPRRRGSGR